MLTLWPEYSDKSLTAALLILNVVLELAGAIRAIMDESHMKFVKIIKRGQNRGEIVDFIEAEQLALMIIGSFRLLVTKWHMSKNSFDLEIRTKKMVKAFEKLM